MNYYFGEQVQY